MKLLSRCMFEMYNMILDFKIFKTNFILFLSCIYTSSKFKRAVACDTV